MVAALQSVMTTLLVCSPWLRERIVDLRLIMAPGERWNGDS